MNSIIQKQFITPYANTKNVYTTCIKAIIIILLTVILPLLLLSSYRLHQANTILIYAMVILSLNLLIAYSGQLSLGHGAFYAIGAYTAGLLMQHYSVSYLLSIPLAGFASVIVSTILIIPLLRLTGIYFSLITISFGTMVPYIIKYYEPFTGGSQGLNIKAVTAPFNLPLSEDQWGYILIITIAALLYKVSRKIVDSHFGLTLRAIRDNTLAASCAGINTRLYKGIIFILTAFYAGVAGALTAITTHFIAPEMFPAELSLVFLVGSIIGGLGSILGSLIGGFFILIIPNLASDVSHGAPMVIYGIIVIIVMRFLPNGAMGLVYKLLVGSRR